MEIDPAHHSPKPVSPHSHSYSDDADSADEATNLPDELMPIPLDNSEFDVSPEQSEAELDDERNEDDDAWRGFDEILDADNPTTVEEMLKELEEMLSPDEEADLWDIRNEILSEQDRDNIRAFRLKMLSSMSHEVFAQMRHAFRSKLEISSHWVMIHRVAILSGVTPVWYHCCVNSCMAYTGEHSDLIACRYSDCQEPRFTAVGKPHTAYSATSPSFPDFKDTSPTPRRHNYKRIAGSISDIFDSEHYRTLCTKKVVVDGKELPHRYFSGKNDIALGFCSDSYLLFERRRKGPSATPFSALGPKGPRDMHSYCIPYDEECAKLAVGVPTFDSLTREVFDLHAYNIFGMGDIIAIEKLINIKGHNSLSACRTCEMKGRRNVTGGETIYYMPLAAPSDSGEIEETWDPRNLPMRADQDFQDVSDQLDALDAAGRPGDKEKLAKYHGIKGLPALRRVGSMDRARSYPWDGMHLFFENIIPNMVKHWTGKFKGLDSGREDYEIPEAVWDQVWAETAEAMSHIPSDFSRSLVHGPSKFTAESWCFWFVYMAPGLLQNRFADQKYHDHLCELSEIIKTCLKFTITHNEIDLLEERIIKWVETYELIYYQYQEDRLCACPLVIHGIVHIPGDIRFCGPMWTTWTFFMERYCGFLKAGLRSKTHPWANLNNRITNYAYLEQIGARYDLTDELAIFGHRSEGSSRSEKIEEGYPLTILRTPYRKIYTPDDALRRKIAGYFSSVLSKPIAQILKRLPDIIPSWGKVRILGGDSIRSASAIKSGAMKGRDASYVRYLISLETDEGDMEELFYGQLDQILVCDLPVDRLLGDLSGKRCLLAVLIPCATGGRDATQEILSYNHTTTTIVTDIRTVHAVVGRFKTRGKWVIVDRTAGLIKPEFVPSSEAKEQEDGAEDL
ncbi:hypothetical protein C8J57DRAFT_1469942 [Mycena rebaudengoi]|nr:hypothetical protein C8J57DRAFT_1469942 [Mycena rebaudengoi]